MMIKEEWWGHPWLKSVLGTCHVNVCNIIAKEQTDNNMTRAIKIYTQKLRITNKYHQWQFTSALAPVSLQPPLPSPPLPSPQPQPHFPHLTSPHLTSPHLYLTSLHFQPSLYLNHTPHPHQNHYNIIHLTPCLIQGTEWYGVANPPSAVPGVVVMLTVKGKVDVPLATTVTRTSSPSINW